MLFLSLIERIAVIASEDIDLQSLLKHLSLERDDGVLEFEPHKLKHFGIGDEELGTVDEKKKRDLVLERVAMVAIR